MEADAQLFAIRAAIAKMSEPEQARVLECAQHLQTTIAEYGSVGITAMALIGAALAAEGGVA